MTKQLQDIVKKQIEIELKTLPMITGSVYERGKKISESMERIATYFYAIGIQEMFEKSKRIYVNTVDWSEWGMSRQDASNKFEEELKALNHLRN